MRVEYPGASDDKQPGAKRSIRENVLWRLDYTEAQRVLANRINRFILIDSVDA